LIITVSVCFKTLLPVNIVSRKKGFYAIKVSESSLHQNENNDPVSLSKGKTVEEHQDVFCSVP